MAVTTSSPAQVVPNRGLAFITLGASLHDILCRLKAQPQTYPTIELSYSTSHPVLAPVLVDLPANGIRLRFDGPDQRLRLIEVLNFTKTRLTYKNIDVVKLPKESDHFSPTPAAVEQAATGPTFRHVYNRLLGPTFPGEYLSPDHKSESAQGLYVLSYPGIAFSFPLQSSAWSPETDFVSLLSSSAASPAASMAIFNGSSWHDARADLLTRTPPHPRSLSLAARAKDGGPEEIELVKVHGAGRIELSRRSGTPFWIILSETTPQDLVAELGPPDAIYRKNDRRLSIHRASTLAPGTAGRPTSPPGRAGDVTDTDHSTTTDESEDDDRGTISGLHDPAAAECFYNYFSHGFDIFVSNPTAPSPLPPPARPDDSRTVYPTNHLTATKVLLHANVPGSYPFNRHRRSRWTLEHIPVDTDSGPLNSEMGFDEISRPLKDAWKSTYAGEAEEEQSQKGMVLNRGWGDSPGSSCELLGGWEESLGGSGKRRQPADNAGDSEQGLGNTQLFGFPGMVFEVLKNGAISCLTIF
ncbi:MAG: hypothetical protein M1832_000758 [Thelocarpon impressellum]|nr:MAG: hypothetical protein M1832_000758 [Thelocarpon impressellum]